jgi:hypothetical protein
VGIMEESVVRLAGLFKGHDINPMIDATNMFFLERRIHRLFNDRKGV